MRKSVIMACLLEKEEYVLGRNSKLKPEQMKMLKTTLLENTPDQLGLNFSLWIRQVIQNLIINFWDISVNSWEIHEKAWIYSTKTN